MQFKAFSALTNKIGPMKMAEYLVRAATSRRSKETMRFQLPHMANPVEIRTATSDMQVFHDIFIWDEYGFLLPNTNRLTVLDIGANVGYSSTYFAGIYSRCNIVAVELMHTNFLQLCKNTAFLGDRIKAIEGAVWSHSNGVAIADDTFRDGDEWSHHASEATDGTSLVPSITMLELMQKHNMHHVNICKIDIEGAEYELFAPGNRDWVRQCDVILLEIHEDLGNFNIVSEMRTDGYKSFTAHELTIFYRDIETAKRFIKDEYLSDTTSDTSMMRVA